MKREVIQALITAFIIAASGCGDGTKTTVDSRSYTFDGTISRNVLDSYLSRAITMSSVLHGTGCVDDNIRMLKDIGAKFIGRAILRWGGEASLEDVIATAVPIAQRLHKAEPDMILQACIFEIVTTLVNEVPVPAWVFEEFGMEPKIRNFRYEDMIYPDGAWVDHWAPGQSVPDMSSPETRMWFYFLAACYIDIGIEAIHFGQVEIMDDRDPDHEYWRDMLRRVRSYARENARRHILICDAHVPGGGFAHQDTLMFDFHSFPLRIEEVIEKPHKGVLKMGYLDSLYGRSLGGITPSGWRCESLPYLAEIDNFGASGHAGENIGQHYIWGWDEISWFAHRDPEYRRQWLHYAWDWIRKNDPNGWLQMPGIRPINPPVDGRNRYFVNDPANCPDGFGDADTIRDIWAVHRESELSQ